MASAQQKEIDELPQLATDGLRPDFQSLLHAIHASNINNLSSLHPRGKVLFAEGEPARGVFILRTGRASVSIASSEGKVVILRIAQPGDVLGLSSVLRDSNYNTTVKTIESSRTDFILRAELIELMERSQPGALAIMRILSQEIAELTERARSLLLPQTANAKLARLLLEWCEVSGANNSNTIRIERVFTQEEIAQMICSSRETVTRLLAGLSRRRIISIMSDSILIRDHAALENIALGKKLDPATQ